METRALRLTPRNVTRICEATSLSREALKGLIYFGNEQLNEAYYCVLNYPSVHGDMGWRSVIITEHYFNRDFVYTKKELKTRFASIHRTWNPRGV